jgi:carbonic anhydrase/acetyltransferase-like protein (isoleucine patch superfamily)
VIYDYADRKLDASAICFIAPSADVIGSVRLGEESSVWFNAVLRGDNDWIIVGAGSNVQDGSIIHTDPGLPVTIGARVTVGHQVMLHGCTIEDDSLIGNGAIVLDGAHIGAGSLIAAGALIAPNARIPPGSVVMGSPGKVARSIAERDLQRMHAGCEAYRRKAREYAAKLVARQ